MLASIHPLGERARGNSFPVTSTAYTLGSVAGAAGLGAMLGWVGAVAFGGLDATIRVALVAVAAAVSAVLDWRGRPIPSPHRQVNEDWLTEYRGWVYGVGFGFQLGLGVVTIVTTAAVYLTWFAATMTASLGAGVLVGAAFGIARALPLVVSGALHTPDAIAARVGRLDGWAGSFSVVTVSAEAVVAASLAALAVR